MTTPGRDHIGVGVGALVADSELSFLLARRGPAARNETGLWEFPGGGIEFGERLADGIVREFREEYGIGIEVFDTLGVFDHILPAEHQHWVSVTFLARHVTGTATVREPSKCAEIGWFPIEGLPSPLSRISADNAEKYGRDGSRWDEFRRWAGGGA